MFLPVAAGEGTLKKEVIGFLEAESLLHRWRDRENGEDRTERELL